MENHLKELFPPILNTQIQPYKLRILHVFTANDSLGSLSRATEALSQLSAHPEDSCTPPLLSHLLPANRPPHRPTPTQPPPPPPTPPLSMDAHALLTRQGWRGTGHSLHPTSDANGLTHHILIKQNADGSGLGSKKDHKQEAWWLNAFDAALKGIDTKAPNGGLRQTVKGAESALGRITRRGAAGKYVGSRGLYSSFVRGGLIEGTVGREMGVLTPPESGTGTPMAEEGGKKEKGRETKEERRLGREKKKKKKKKKQGGEKENAKARTEKEAEERAARKVEKKKAKKAERQAERVGETKEERRARREARRKRKEESRRLRAAKG
ncbi:hypothetical protein F5Y15DRAFT_428781 [Xylariaceae sp. FL0016]|nr:hypothetical protein F5Y15DRAFT_428781 [Xylariaceae sp. FL0016]